MENVENQMVVDGCWPQNTPEYIGQCENCKEDVAEGMEYIKLGDGRIYCNECYERYI